MRMMMMRMRKSLPFAAGADEFMISSWEVHRRITSCFAAFAELFPVGLTLLYTSSYLQVHPKEAAALSYLLFNSKKLFISRDGFSLCLVYRPQVPCVSYLSM
jgi:hypothetical protein